MAKFTNLPIFKESMKTLKSSGLINKVTIDVYGLVEKPTQVPDLRMAVVRPFNWVFINHNFNVNKLISGTGLVGLDKFCTDSNTTPYVRLNKYDSGFGVDKLKLDCLPFSVSQLFEYFSSSRIAKVTLTLSTERLTRFSDIQAINYLLKSRFFIVDPATI